MASSGRESAPKMASPEQAASMKGMASTSVVAAQRNDANGSSAMASTLAASTARPITSTLLTGDIASMSRSTSRNDSRDDSFHSNRPRNSPLARNSHSGANGLAKLNHSTMPITAGQNALPSRSSSGKSR